jgi:hypothetical protein
VTGNWSKLYDEGLHNFKSSLNAMIMIKLGRMRWTGHIAHMGEMRNTYKILAGKYDGKNAPGRARRTWNDNIVAYRPVARQRPRNNEITAEYPGYR